MRSLRFSPSVFLVASLLVVLAQPALLAGGTRALSRDSWSRDSLYLRLAIEARRLALSTPLWPGWSTAPSQVLLVSDSLEYLIGAPGPANGFSDLAGDFSGERVQSRPRVFSPTLLATFPAVNGTPTIVIGTTATTRLSPAAWTATLAHEHMHQWQYSRPGYYDRVQQLDLARGDTTGMWMLNFAVPYTDTVLGHALAAFAHTLNTQPAASLSVVREAWRQVERAAGTESARYLAFQFWQEGVARFTEEAFARAMAGGSATSTEPSRDTSLTRRHFAALADSLAQRRTRRIGPADVARRKREIAYPIGAALAAWMDAQQPSWRSNYAATTLLRP